MIFHLRHRGATNRVHQHMTLDDLAPDELPSLVIDVIADGLPYDNAKVAPRRLSPRAGTSPPL